MRRVRSFSDAEAPVSPRSYTAPYYNANINIANDIGIAQDKPRPLSLGRTLTDQFRHEQARLDRPRLPDRNSLKIDVFGRRRCVPDNGGEFSATLSLPRANLRPEAQSLSSTTGSDNNSYLDSDMESESTTTCSSLAPQEDDDPIAFGPLATSLNMNKALDKTLRSKDGLVKRKDKFGHGYRQPLIDKKQMAAAVNSLKPKTSSRDIKTHLSLTKSSKFLSNMNNNSNNNHHHSTIQPAVPTFSTTMSAKQAAATLETTCRDMSCRVKRVPNDEDTLSLSAGLGTKVKLKISRPGPRFGAPNQRRVKAYIIIHEHDKLRTDVYLNKIPVQFGISDHAAFNALTDDIRWRFQREWPRLVDALYIRAPA